MGTAHDSATPVRASMRVAAVDSLRGLALVGMVCFHFGWDLAYLHLSGIDPATSPPWRVFGSGVAALFIGLSGFGMVLAAQKGTLAALRRIARVAAAALLVTAVTTVLFPPEAIVFGILHCIAVTNALALPLLRAPLALVAAVALAALAAPGVLARAGLDVPAWWWLGLSATLPRTLDVRPVLPWFGVVLIGQCVGRLLPLKPTAPGAGRLATRCLAWAGRHSLLLYLVHQPILLAMLTPLASLPTPPFSFVERCRVECVAAGAQPDVCRAACRCAAQRIEAPGGSPSPVPSPEELRSAALACIGPGDGGDR